MINGIQPDVLAAQARAADNTLNNQSLVILFSFRAKISCSPATPNGETGKISFTVARTERRVTPEVTKKATDILSNIDFYKVGHHGSCQRDAEGRGCRHADWLRRNVFDANPRL